MNMCLEPAAWREALKLNLLVRSRTEAIHSQERRPATGGLQDVRRIIQKNATEIDSYEEDFEALPWSVVG